MRLETRPRKSLGMKAHTVTHVEEQPDGSLVAQVECLPGRRLACGACGRPPSQVADTRRPARRLHDLSVRDQPLWPIYAPAWVRCPICGLRVERIPRAEKWQRATHSLARAVATLARKLDWRSVAAHFRLNWKMVASVVEAAVLWGVAHRRWVPLHLMGIDEVSRRKGLRYQTLDSNLARRRVVWVGKEREEATLQRFFAWLGKRRARAIQVVCCDMWRPYLAVVRQAVPSAMVVFDRFRLTRYATEAVDTVRRQLGRQLAEAEKPACTRTRLLWLKNPENLERAERTRLSALVGLNAPIVRAALLKEDLRRFWDYRSTAWAAAHLRQRLWRASHSRLAPFVKLAQTLRVHLDGILAWTTLRVTNGALEGMSSKAKAISHRAFGFRTTWTYISTIYHCCAQLPLP